MIKLSDATQTAINSSLADPRRQEILRSARRAFMTLGFALARMEPIARQAGVSTATLYGFFSSKDDLFAAVIVDAADDFERRVIKLDVEGTSVRARLISFMTAYAEFMGDPFIRSIFRLVIAERPRFHDVATQFFNRGRSDFGRPLIKALADLAAAGELRIDKGSWAAGELMGMIEHPIFFMPLVTGEEVRPTRPIPQIVEHAVDTFMARYGNGSSSGL